MPQIDYDCPHLNKKRMSRLLIDPNFLRSNLLLAIIAIVRSECIRSLNPTGYLLWLLYTLFGNCLPKNTPEGFLIGAFKTAR